MADPKALSQSNYHPEVKFVGGDQEATARSIRLVAQAVVPTLKEAYEKVRKMPQLQIVWLTWCVLHTCWQAGCIAELETLPVKVVQGGITNALYHIPCKYDHPELLIRIFGAEGTPLQAWRNPPPKG